MAKKFISIIILACLVCCFCGCTVYKYNPMPSDFDAEHIIGRSPEDIIAEYGEPDLTERYYVSETEEGEIYAILYKTGSCGIFLDSYSEYVYIHFDPNTGLADTVVHPWTDYAYMH